MGSRLRGCSLIFGISYLRVLVAQNLTTITLLQPTSARPTTIVKRIEVHKDEEKSTTVDMFETKAFKSRRSYTDIWKWDIWCQQQPKTGNCNLNITKYYYDSQLDHCLPFSYSGCKGNKNQFETLVDCERHCKGAAFMPVKYGERTTSCALQPGTGRCLGYFLKWHYDINTRKCDSFVFGGCGGNSNKFSTYSECMAQCEDQIYNYGRAGPSGELDKHGKDSEDSTSSDDAYWHRI